MARRSTFSSSSLIGYSKMLAALALSGLTAQIAALRSRRPGLASHHVQPSRRRPTKAFIAPAVWWSILRAAVSGWMTHKASTLGAAIAYYSLFSMGPLILIAIMVAGLAFGAQVVREQVILQLSHLLGEQGAKAVQNMLLVAGQPAEGVFATLIGAGALAFAAVSVVVQLKAALNAVWEVDAPSGSGVWAFFRTYAVSLAGVLSLGFLLLVSLLLTTALAAMSTMFANAAPEIVLQTASVVVTFAMTAVLFAMMFKWLPDISIGWRDVLPGSILTAALFEIGKFLIGFYIGKQGLESTYGAAASLVVVLIWVYYSAQLVLFGAEFTRAYAWTVGHRRGREPRNREGRPAGNARDRREGLAAGQ
ncbi:YihY/virulence factor BrkB family protein [Taklimakanibacter deserti]|uniref:YihY/virulence factor BrkB family protein n=1 Tax=Taklimakanibacter deserti TaxID=2267839 RepID=UPI0034D4BCAA